MRSSTSSIHQIETQEPNLLIHTRPHPKHIEPTMSFFGPSDVVTVLFIIAICVASLVFLASQGPSTPQDAAVMAAAEEARKYFPEETRPRNRNSSGFPLVVNARGRGSSSSAQNRACEIVKVRPQAGALTTRNPCTSCGTPTIIININLPQGSGERCRSCHQHHQHHHYTSPSEAREPRRPLLVASTPASTVSEISSESESESEAEGERNGVEEEEDDDVALPYRMKPTDRRRAPETQDNAARPDGSTRPLMPRRQGI